MSQMQSAQGRAYCDSKPYVSFLLWDHITLLPCTPTAYWHLHLDDSKAAFTFPFHIPCLIEHACFLPAAA